MNFRLLAKILGTLLFLQAVAMLFCLAFTYLDHGEAARSAGLALGISAGITGTAGVILWLQGPGKIKKIPRREGITIVGLGWILSGLFGAVPYMLCEPRLAPAAAIFESVSGFTTTGSTAMEDIEAWPRGLLMWRSVTQWMGGLGILVLFVAVLSAMGVGGKNLFRNESTVATGDATARVRDTALVVLRLYLTFTTVCLLGLKCLGLTWFNATCHAFTTVSTGGFSPHNASVGYYSNWDNILLIELWLSLFMIVGSINFLFWAALARRKWARVKSEEEGLGFVAFCVIASIVLMFDLLVTNEMDSAMTAWREGFFNFVSIISTTGFGTTNYDEWPALSLLILGIAMFIGGCGGSTAGGYKFMRLLVLFKVARYSVIRAFRPNQVFRMRLNKQSLSQGFRDDVMTFLCTYFFIFFGATVVVAGLETSSGINFDTSIGAVLATLFNIGPGFDGVGPTENFGWLRPSTQLFLSVLMILGRLELYAVLVLFVPALWKKY